ncbi:MAG: hypothetical protein L0H79_20545 [Intrasporangium sp.]|uniref:hypothetical protein n=1 Tax=Intrasporangium sp. TaxID=1925024 RepID=UPI0026481A4E|nr:hypothetical protein [Intrasporangium sp.]MDN5798116.1 hypothetical protein [Intrasporangium sp.]
MRRLLGPALLLLLAAVSLLFLQHRDHPAAATAPSTSTSTSTSVPPAPTLPPATVTQSTPSTTSDSSPSSSIAEVEPDGTPVPPSASAAAHGPAEAARFKLATSTATAFMTAFARPSAAVDQVAWWTKVRSFMTDQAAADYEGTDPAQVPYARITGAAAVIPTDAPTDLLTAVRVPTDVGDYIVEFTTGDHGMQVSRVVPPSAG